MNRPTLQLWVTPCLQQAALHLAKLRTQGHAASRKPYEDRGRINNERIDLFGLMAEMTVYHVLECNGLHPQSYVLIAGCAPTEPDFVLNGRTYDVKSVLPGSRFLCCNEHKRVTQSPDFILPAVFESRDRIALYKPIPGYLVASWELRRGHSAYRSIAVSQLTPISDIREVEQ